jgi:hypothetical protein
LDLGHNLSVPTAKTSDTAGQVTQHKLLAAAAAFAAAAIFDTATNIALDAVSLSSDGLSRILCERVTCNREPFGQQY